MASLYLDNDVSADLAPLLTRLHHSVVATRDLGYGRADDDAQLLLAASRGWTLITHNTKDYRLLHDAWQRWTASWGVTARQSGILIIPQISPQQNVRAVDEFFGLGLRS